MKTLIIIALVLLASPALAQQQQQTFTIVLTGPQIDLIGKALGKLPFEEVSGVVGVISTQIAGQQQKAAQAKAEADKAAIDKAVDGKGVEPS